MGLGRENALKHFQPSEKKSIHFENTYKYSGFQ